MSSILDSLVVLDTPLFRENELEYKHPFRGFFRVLPKSKTKASKNNCEGVPF